ncbi:RNA polymerase I-specific transcription initiation factor RRN3 [Oopsacas minuta]|uniref:RNA polymerase I-specific transcription initiation factor RRN3 n=1 Tax=Oopsacas minuta TaxID=111878 RepID=A0AAV7JT97_9METZ|nr:RNA polymerase I-specific transcription initiation factor RRN3 [Oopsacas minuta]
MEQKEIIQKDCPENIDFSQALKNKSLARRKQYEQLVTLISSSKSDRDAFGTFITNAIENISLLTPQAGTLIQTLLELPWSEKCDEISEKFIEFISQLITHQIHSLRICIIMVMKMFTHFDLDNSSSYMENIRENSHNALQTIFTLVPTSPCLFIEVIESEYPYKGKSTSIHESLLTNLLQVANTYPPLEQEIVQIITNNLIKMDAETPRKELEEISQDLDTLHECVDLDPILHKTHQYAIKVDKLVSLILKNIKTYVFRRSNSKSDKLSKSRLRRIYPTYLSTFIHVILPTHGASHIQSIILYLSSLDLELSITFIDSLWTQVTCLESPPVVRESACCYLASYISRAKFLTSQIVVDTMLTISQWLHKYIDKTAGISTCPDVIAHGTFYSLAQALFYIFVFRHKLLFDLPNGIEFINSLTLQNIIFSKLNPLKVCLSTITDMFAGICKHYQILFCYTLIEQNKRLYLPQTLSALAETSDNYLLSFFPFDPFLLPSISNSLNPLLFSWTEVEPAYMRLEELATQAEESVLDMDFDFSTDETLDYM